MEMGVVIVLVRVMVDCIMPEVKSNKTDIDPIPPSPSSEMIQTDKTSASCLSETDMTYKPFWGIKLGLALQQIISMVGRRAHVFGNLILIDFALLKMRIRPPVPEWCHIEIWSIWERNTESVCEKYISTNRWQIQSQVSRNAIQRTNAVMLVWTEIPMQLQRTVQMQAQICRHKYKNTITQATNNNMRLNKASYK